MALLVIGLILFFGAHCVSIVTRPWRDRMAARIGHGPWRGLYSLIALAGLLLIIYGYGAARGRPTILYVPPFWLHYVTIALMLPVFPLLFAAYLPGRIQRSARHPMLLAVKLWAAAHLLANGALADVLLFGSFLVWAGVDRISVQRRSQRPAAEAPPRKVNDRIALVAGLAVYAVLLLGGHAWLFGVPASRWRLF